MACTRLSLLFLKLLPPSWAKVSTDVTIFVNGSTIADIVWIKRQLPSIHVGMHNTLLTSMCYYSHTNFSFSFNLYVRFMKLSIFLGEALMSIWTFTSPLGIDIQDLEGPFGSISRFWLWFLRRTLYRAIELPTTTSRLLEKSNRVIGH